MGPLSHIPPQRKLDDALQTLDDAVFVPPNPSERPPPPKKSRSIYSTLAKYGITSKQSKPLVHPTDSICYHAPTVVRLLHPDPPLLGWNPSRNPPLTLPLSSLEARSNLEARILQPPRFLSLLPRRPSTGRRPPLHSSADCRRTGLRHMRTNLLRSMPSPPRSAGG